MAGLYLHIPFCKQKCSYCDFHFSTSLKHKKALIRALGQEIEQRKQELNEPIETIYFGGGTPSLLSERELYGLVESINKHYNLASNVEFTLECNPDDLSSSKLQGLKQSGVNRLSIGVQSFRDKELHFFNRSHTAKQAEASIKNAQEVGIQNITIDLIYGTPTLDLKGWEYNLDVFETLNIPHLSAYALTVEPKTALHHQVKKKQTTMPKDEQVIDQFYALKRRMKALGLDHYEISNFGKSGLYSKHNSNYWRGVSYLGFGPSAHSFLGIKRRWNVSSNLKYMEAIESSEPYSGEESIDDITAYNEYVLTGLRTMWGIDKAYVQDRFNDSLNRHFQVELEKLKKTSYLQIENNKITLTEEGIIVADGVASDLFYVK